MPINRQKTKEIKVGRVVIGGDNPVRVQSMCKTRTADVKATIKQIQELEKVGCEIVRVAVPDRASAKSLSKIKKQISIPLVADIHYDYQLALEALNQGADKIRINPGNIPQDKLGVIAKEAKATQVPIRIGVNIGSLPKEVVKEFGSNSQAMVEAALKTIEFFESLDFYDIIVSLKSSDILQTIEANVLFSKKSDYPLHLGITEAGTIRSGTIKSSIGIGYLLLRGIGDTIRVSLSASPIEEVLVGYGILKTVGRRAGVSIISCPTCGRATLDVVSIANKLERRLIGLEKPVKIGVLGCFVNQDEARMAAIGIAGAGRHGVLFKQGKMIRKIEKDKLIDELLEEIRRV